LILSNSQKGLPLHRGRPFCSYVPVLGSAPRLVTASCTASKALDKYGMVASMSRPANPYDNASCESFMKTLKREEIYTNRYNDLETFELINVGDELENFRSDRDVLDFAHWCNIHFHPFLAVSYPKTAEYPFLSILSRFNVLGLQGAGIKLLDEGHLRGSSHNLGPIRVQSLPKTIQKEGTSRRTNLSETTS
jgi:hypothetical protein